MLTIIDTSERGTLRAVPNAGLDVCREMVAHERLELALHALPATARLVRPRVHDLPAQFAAATAPTCESHTLAAEAEHLRSFLGTTYLGLPDYAGDLLAYESAIFALRMAAATADTESFVPATTSSRLSLRRCARLLFVRWNVTEIAAALVAREPFVARRIEMRLALKREAAEMDVGVAELDPLAYRVADAARLGLRACDVATSAHSASEAAISMKQVLDHIAELRAAGFVSVW